MEKSKVYFRADGNSQMGLGHVIRSLALAEMLTPVFECHFVIRKPLTTLKAQILDICHAIIELPETEDDISEAQTLARRFQPSDIVVLDGYHFRTTYQQTIKGQGCKLVCIDDIHAYHFVADVVINHAPGLDTKVYSVEPYTQLCLGLDYSLLRKPFLEAIQPKVKIEHFTNVFICFGGVDLNNNTLKVIQDLDSYAPIKSMQVVVGAGNRYKDAILKFANRSTRNILVAWNLDAESMVKTMKNCQLAIAPASTILYELSCMRIPTISGYYVDNQKNICQGFDQLGLIKNIGDLNKIQDYQTIIKDFTKAEADDIQIAQAQFQKGNSPKEFRHLFQNLSLYQ